MTATNPTKHARSCKFKNKTLSRTWSATQPEEWIKKIKIQKIPEIQASVNDVILYLIYPITVSPAIAE